ncbi:MAG: hypothetical protein RIF34_03740, partial [Candidatus Kapaibacterium sp.]
FEFYSKISPAYYLFSEDNLLEVKLSELDSKINEIDQSKERIDNILKSVEEDSKKIGVGKYSNLFFEESRLNTVASRIWLALIALAVVGIWIIAYYFFDTLKTLDLTDTQQVIQFSIFKITLLGSLLYIISILKVNYNAQRHNQTVNKHRHNALLTFEAFTSATEDENTKNAVLLEATRTIFSNQRTGYLKEDKETDNNTIIEYIKSGNKG